jgi:hypothetical protein
MRVLLGETPPTFQPMTANKEATETVFQAARVQSKYWKNVKAPPFEPETGNADDYPTVNLKFIVLSDRPGSKTLTW